MKKVWVLDRVGYDARGGNAQVFSSAEQAKAAASWVKKWEPDGSGWREPGDVLYGDLSVIYEVVVDHPD